MRTRSTVVAALAGLFVSLLIMGSFLALDRTTLHWYVAGAEDGGLTAAEAEAYTISHVLHKASFVRWKENGWLPDCEAKDRSQDGWLVGCGLLHQRTDATRPRIVTYLVGDDGVVTRFPGSGAEVPQPFTPIDIGVGEGVP